MIDYFIISRALLGTVVSILVDFDSAWSPHYGLELQIRSRPKEVEHFEVVQPTLPKDIENSDAGAHNETSLQLKKAPACKLQKKELKEAKLIELDIRKTNDNKAWKDIFDSVPVRSLKPKGDDDTSAEVYQIFREDVGRNVFRKSSEQQPCDLVPGHAGISLA